MSQNSISSPNATERTSGTSPSQRIYAFDFDGTLTTSDSLMEIICWHRGRTWLIAALLLMLPKLVLMFLHLYSNQKSKEELLLRCFGHISRDDFSALCHRFAASHSHILRPSTCDVLRQAHEAGHEVRVVTASPAMWVSAFLPGVKVLGTELEFDSNGFTGRFLTPNCYGQEKVERLLKEFPALATQRGNIHLTAYGDSRGDREMLAFADDPHLIKE